LKEIKTAPERRLEAERIVKWVLIKRNQCLLFNPEKAVDEHDAEKGEDRFITQVAGENTDDTYAQCTIYPVHQTKKNIPASDLYQMIKVAAQPLDSRDTNLDVKCFPDLYFNGEGGQHQPREEKLSGAEFVKCRLMSKH